VTNPGFVTPSSRGVEDEIRKLSSQIAELTRKVGAPAPKTPFPLYEYEPGVTGTDATVDAAVLYSGVAPALNPALVANFALKLVAGAVDCTAQAYVLLTCFATGYSAPMPPVTIEAFAGFISYDFGVDQAIILPPDIIGHDLMVQILAINTVGDGTIHVSPNYVNGITRYAAQQIIDGVTP
jgi:hypothetical protein